jgi:hypothetical protein
LALAAGGRLRHQRLKSFLSWARADESTTVLDVGVTNTGAGAANYLEEEYPWPGHLTACGLEGCPEVCRRRGIPFVAADGCDLPFEDGRFDVAHCNAVIEHVGSQARQERLAAELCRVARRVWLSTPDQESSLESHTLIPMAHWLPAGLRRAVYRARGLEFFADEANLLLLSAGELRRRFPCSVRSRMEIRRQYVLGFPIVLIATV